MCSKTVSRLMLAGFASLVALVLCLSCCDTALVTAQCPGPGPCPMPDGPRRPRPQPGPKPGSDSVVNGREYQGEQLSCDFPSDLHMTNIGSHVDGAGMCVMTSIEMAARWAGLDQMRGLRDWCAQQAGGGYPSKVDQQVQAYCKAKGIPVPAYIQYEGPNPETVLDLCNKTGRVAAITYGYSPRYGKTIAHMTCCPHFSGQWGVCMDNNFIGGVDKEHLFEWMDRNELLNRVKHPSGSGWVFAWAAPSPPPPPRNKAADDIVEAEVFGPYVTRFAALDKAEELRRRGWRCDVFEERVGRWYVRAHRRKF